MSFDFLPATTRTLMLESIVANIKTSDDKRASFRFGVRTWLKPEIDKFRMRLETHIGTGLNGLEGAQALSCMVDAVLGFLLELHDKTFTKTSTSDVALIATGGYGRALMAPFSDVDILFLVKQPMGGKTQEKIENLLYALWDLGFKVGHATRSKEQCVELALQDATIRTALLDARFLCGERTLADAFFKAFAAKVKKAKLADYVAEKIEERKGRFLKFNASRYRVEPNIKEGRGALRDIHLFRWMFQSVYGVERDEELLARGFLERNELSRLRKAERFLWSVRMMMHFAGGRAEEQLTFDMQGKVAKMLGYADKDGMLGAERLMRHYFLTAQNVGSLMTILWSYLEKDKLKAEPILAKFALKLFKGRSGTQSDVFFDDFGRAQAQEGAIETTSENILEFFDYCTKLQKKPHPLTLKRIKRACQKSDFRFELMQNVEAQQKFLRMMMRPQFSEKTLRTMHEVGLIGALIPEFLHVVCRMQFNAYHFYTVDEHLIRTVGCLKRFENGQLSAGTAQLQDLLGEGAKRNCLYLAALIHDIAKGLPEDHSTLGAKWALDIAPRMGLSAENTQLVAWLVENHLVMSETAQSRDLSDSKTIADFAALVGSLERLRLLYVLTLCDIAAVGPQKLTSWKEELLQQLFLETSYELGSDEVKSRSVRISEAQNGLYLALKDFDEEFARRHVGRLFPSYFLQVPKGAHVRHGQMFWEMQQTGELVRTHVDTDAARGLTELTLIAPDHPRLLAGITGACAQKYLNIIEARIDTTRDGFALDTIAFARSFDDDFEELERAKRIAKVIENILKGESKITDILPDPAKSIAKNIIFNVDNIVKIENDLSINNTVIEIECLDRPGLLYEITTILNKLNINIHSAKITTYGEKAIDVFYVTDLTGAKITDKTRQKSIRQTLQNMLVNPLTLKKSKNAPI